MPSSKKPYLDKKKSIRDFFSGRSRFLKEEMGKESELEKPYLSQDRAVMHFDLPIPDWGGPSNFPGNRRTSLRAPHIKISSSFIPSVPFQIPKAITGSSCFSCFITCDEPTECGDPIECRTLIFCTGDRTGFGRDTKWEVNALVGKIDHSEHGGGSSPSIDVYVDENEAINIIEICLIDGLGHRCCEYIELSCEEEDCCLIADPFLIDEDATPDTITPGNSITVFMNGGCPPYTWAVSGTGYSWATGTTEDLTNLLSVVSGVCGTHYDPFATITVTDFCGTIAGGDNVILISTGRWVRGGDCSRNNDPELECGGTFVSGVTCPGGEDDIIEGMRKWSAVPACYCSDGCLPCAWTSDGINPCTIALPESCSSPCNDCWASLISCPSGVPHIGAISLRNWEC